NAKDVKTEIDNTLRVSAPLRPCVKLENNNAKVQRRDGAKNKSLRVYFTGIFGCAVDPHNIEYAQISWFFFVSDKHIQKSQNCCNQKVIKSLTIMIVRLRTGIELYESD
ncbi:MAG: hypothetical protein U9N46_07360, partial [Euryarchaeota archaeon]|nr:hypothetical protein [Euryarchaeota archaeon]